MAQEKRRLSRRTFVAGTCGTAFGLAAGIGGTKYLVDKTMPPENQIPSIPADGFWLESTTSRLTDQIPLKGNHKADVVIVGAGFTGISTAFHLSEAFPDRRILLLEANIAGAGASGKNNGLAIEGMSGIEPIMAEWIAKERVDKAREVWEKASSGIKIIEKLVREHDLDCDWAPVDMLFSPLTPGQEERCTHLRRRHELLDIDSKWLSEDMVAQKIGIKGFRGALAIPGGASVNPVKLILSVGKLAKKRGVEVYENTPVMKIEPGSQVKVHLQYGTVQTSALILATNAYTSNLGIFKQRIIPVHSHTIVTAPLTDHQVESLWKGREPITDMANMFLGLHLTADNRILCANKDGFYYYGGSIDTGKGHPIYSVLVQSLRDHFPALSDIPVTHHWVGTVGVTLDLVPTVGLIGPHQNIFFGGGYSGHGIGPGFLFGKLLSRLYAGEAIDPVFEFALNRKPPWIPPEPFTSAGFALARRYMHWQDKQ
jgi:glycine/D-amino acid oxidase-like deaminating enzyme